MAPVKLVRELLRMNEQVELEVREREHRPRGEWGCRLRYLKSIQQDLFTEQRNDHSLQQFITGLTIRALQSWKE